MLKKSKKLPYGYSLIELLVVIIISGIILGLISNAFISFQKKVANDKNLQILEAVHDEINRFLENNGHFPCPASLTDDMSSPNFGRQALDTCDSSSTVNGVFDTTGRSGRRIKLGAVPVRDLSLPDEYVADVFGTRIFYAVSASMATEGRYDRLDGAITVIDINSNHITAEPGAAAFVIVSLGKNQTGGYQSVTGSQIAGSCASLSRLEQENCDNDNVFISNISELNGSNYYDDKVIMPSMSKAIQAIPSRGIMYFDLEHCPSGWQDYYGAAPPDHTVACIKI